MSGREGQTVCAHRWGCRFTAVPQEPPFVEQTYRFALLPMNGHIFSPWLSKWRTGEEICWVIPLKNDHTLFFFYIVLSLGYSSITRVRRNISTKCFWSYSVTVTALLHCKAVNFCPLYRCVFISTCLAMASGLSACSGKVKKVPISCWTWRGIRAITGRWGRSRWATEETSRLCLKAKWAKVQRVKSAWTISFSHQDVCSPPQLEKRTIILHLLQVWIQILII